MKDSGGDIVMLGLLAGAAYLAWNWWTSQPAVAVAVPAVVPAAAYVPSTPVLPSGGCTAPLVMVGGECFPPPLTPGVSGWGF